MMMMMMLVNIIRSDIWYHKCWSKAFSFFLYCREMHVEETLSCTTLGYIRHHWKLRSCSQGHVYIKYVYRSVLTAWRRAFQKWRERMIESFNTEPQWFHPFAGFIGIMMSHATSWWKMRIVELWPEHDCFFFFEKSVFCKQVILFHSISRTFANILLSNCHERCATIAWDGCEGFLKILKILRYCKHEIQVNEGTCDFVRFRGALKVHGRSRVNLIFIEFAKLTFPKSHTCDTGIWRLGHPRHTPLLRRPG